MCGWIVFVCNIVCTRDMNSYSADGRRICGIGGWLYV